MKIFVVDDDSFNAKLVMFHLRRLGYRDVSTYSSGEECLINLGQNPEVIFLDQNMDGISGLETLKEVKRIDPQINVIMLTGDDDENLASQFTQDGALECIVKRPDSMDRITSVLQRIGIPNSKS